MKSIFKKITTITVAMAMVMGMMIVPSQAASKLIEDVEYDGKGVVDVEFSRDVKYKKAKVTVKDNKGKKYKATIVRKDSDDLKFKIKKYKTGRKYTFTIKGVKKWNAKKFGTVKGKVKIDKKFVTKKSTPKGSDYIGIPQAKKVALANVGLTSGQVKFVKAKFEIDDGIPQYDIEFTKDGVEYEFEINAKNGDIMGKDIDVHRNTPAKAKPQGTAAKSANYIGADKAESIALKDAGVSASQVYMDRSEMDYENGRMVYEVEFKGDGYEYSYEIDATTGSVVKREKEWDD